MKLEDFFTRIRPFLLGEESAEDFEARLGPSSSGLRRLAVYQGLVAADLAGVMVALYPSVKVAAERTLPGSWATLVREFARAEPPTHWDINRFGEGFPAFLARRRERHAAQPVLLEELADFHWTDYAAFVHEGGPGAGSLNPTAQVRQYRYAVCAWARQAASGQAPGLPEEKPTTVIVYRDPRTLWTRLFYPNVAALFALARAQGIGNSALVQAAGLTSEDMDRAARHLRREGVLLDQPAPGDG
jgi:hypothetical protein